MTYGELGTGWALSPRLLLPWPGVSQTTLHPWDVVTHDTRLDGEQAKLGGTASSLRWDQSPLLPPTNPLTSFI